MRWTEAAVLKAITKVYSAKKAAAALAALQEEDRVAVGAAKGSRHRACYKKAKHADQ